MTKKRTRRIIGFNPIDLICVVLIIVMAIGAYVRFFAPNTKTVGQTADFYYTLSIKGIKQQALELLERSVNAPFTLDEKITDDMGVLVSHNVRPSMIDYTYRDGTMTKAANPERYDATLTFRVSGSVSDNGFYTINKRALYAGSWYAVRSKWTVVWGQIQNVWQ